MLVNPRADPLCVQLHERHAWEITPAPAQYRALVCGRQRHGFQEPFPVFENLAMAFLLVEIPAARRA
jgi:hypothetical protein